MINQYIAKSENQAGNSYIGSFIKAVYNHKNIKIFNKVIGRAFTLFYDNGYYKAKDIHNNVEVLTDEELFNVTMLVVAFQVIYKILD